MKFGKHLILGLAVITSSIFAAEEKKIQGAHTTQDQKMSEPIKPLEPIKIETPVLVKCFSSKRAFGYGLVATAALFHAGIHLYNTYRNLVARNASQLKTAVAHHVTAALVMGFISHLALNEVSKCDQ